ncbi:MAG TPA: NADH-quinone oxidoreductase subunit C [Ignavibacteria bacterium]|nr:NADH-quinone oxidoreductase subunit C [Ignavibacteria bacterium]
MEDLKAKLKDKFTEANGFSGVTVTEINNYPAIEVPKEKIVSIAEMLRDEFRFDQLRDVFGVDRFTKELRFECIYNLYSTIHKGRMMIRVRLDSKKPEVETLCGVWKSADWYEREAYDMFGINFLNHPDLRRLYMMEEFEYYPLRKDFPLMGIPGSVSLPKK